jgi:UDP-N-acetylglucosamine transferase subunit ALG13
MIFITVGTENFPFNRLMHWVNALLEQKILQAEQEEIVVQYGSCNFIPTGAQGYKLLPEPQFQALLKSARLVISHCGEGSFYLLDSLLVPYILVPRSKCYQEHVDNHQIELSIALRDLGVPVAWSPGDLARFISSPYRVPLSITPQDYLTGLCHQLEQRFGRVSTRSLVPALSHSV